MSSVGKRSVLYISLDGMLEPIGRSQVIAYLRRLSGAFDFHLITFEKPDDLADPTRISRLESELRELGITWYRLPYRPGGKFVAWNIMTGVVLALRTTLRQGVSIIHCRGYIPTLIGFFPRVLFRRKLIFDMRGFWADERLAVRRWTPSHFMYRAIKRLEKLFLLYSDHTISLTHSGIDSIRAFPYMEGRQFQSSVIPTCTDLEHFRISPHRRVFDDPRELVVGYIGNTSNSYLLEPLRLALQALISQLAPFETRVKFLVVSHASRADFTPFLPEGLSGVEFHQSTYEEMPAWISTMDMVAFFLEPSFAKRGSVPTKLGEILACGRPILTNTGYGDVEQTLGGKGVGGLARGLTADAISEAVTQSIQMLRDPELSERCRNRAVEEFSLEKGARMLERIYQSL